MEANKVIVRVQISQFVFLQSFPLISERVLNISLALLGSAIWKFVLRKSI